MENWFLVKGGREEGYFIMEWEGVRREGLWVPLILLLSREVVLVA